MCYTIWSAEFVLIFLRSQKLDALNSNVGAVATHLRNLVAEFKSWAAGDIDLQYVITDAVRYVITDAVIEYTVVA